LGGWPRGREVGWQDKAPKARAASGWLKGWQKAWQVLTTDVFALLYCAVEIAEEDGTVVTAVSALLLH
jgi:hypothetical protein